MQNETRPKPIEELPELWPQELPPRRMGEKAGVFQDIFQKT